MPEVGIVMTLNDKVSSALKTIAGNAKAFDKTLDELEAGFQGLTEAQNGLVAKQTELKKALAESTVKVTEAQKSYKKLKDEASKGALDAAIEEQTRLQQELKNTEQELRLNSKAYDGLYNSALNAAKGMQKTKLETKDFAKGIRDSGLLREFGSALSGAAGAFLTSAIGEPTAQLAYWDAGYTLGQAFSMGRANAMLADFYAPQAVASLPVATRGSGHAYGLDRVPYDDYPALLHEGERVLTAREARAQDAARSSIVINVTGNTFGAGTEEEAAAFFAQRLADQLELHLAAGGGR